MTVAIVILSIAGGAVLGMVITHIYYRKALMAARKRLPLPQRRRRP